MTKPISATDFKSVRPVAHHRDPFHAPAVGVVIVGRVMLGRGVVPEHHGAGLPAQPELVFRNMGLLEQKP